MWGGIDHGLVGTATVHKVRFAHMLKSSSIKLIFFFF